MEAPTDPQLFESFDEDDWFPFFFDTGTHQDEAEPAPLQEDGPMDTSPKLSRTPPQLLTTQPEKMDFETHQFPPLFPQLEMFIKPEPELAEVIPQPPDGSPSSKDEPAEEDEAEPPKRKYTRRRTTTTTSTTAKAPRKKATPSKRGAPAKKNARPTKKQKAGSSDDADEDIELSPFIASLKGMNSTELEQVAETRPLSAKEQAELKKYLRMIKNRESAQLSRERRKVYQDQLEAVLEEEKAKNESLQKKLLELEAQNEVLKNEFLQFRQLIESSNLAKAFSAFSNEKAMVAVTKTAAAGDPKAFATFAMYLLIALSTFGQKLAFGAHLPKGAQFPTDSVGGAVEAQA